MADKQPVTSATKAKKRSSKSKQTRGKRASAAQERQFRDDWQKWTDHLASRVEPGEIDDYLPAKKRSSLLWGLGGLPEFDTLESQLSDWGRLFRQRRSNGKQLARQLESWLGQGVPPLTRIYLVECLFWAQHLPALAKQLTAAPWWALVDHLEAVVQVSDSLQLKDDPLTHQMAVGELPTVLAFQLPELSKIKKQQRRAAKQITLGIRELLDGEGLPHCDHTELVRPLLASWTRSAILAQAAGVDCFGKDERLQYEWLVRQALRLTRSNGSQMLSADPTAKWDKRLIDAALGVNQDRDDHAIAGAMRVGSSRRQSKLPSLSRAPSATLSNWAEFSVLRSSWRPNQAKLAVAFARQQLQVELDLDTTLILGSWNPEIRRDGQVVSQTDSWEEVCWHSDEDVDYLELEAELEHGCKVQRQFLLARQDKLLLVADAVLNDQPSRLEYHASIALGPNVSLCPADETCEGYLDSAKRRHLVIPAALPEWRREPSSGALEASDGTMRLTQSIDGQRLYAPLLIDLSAKRSRGAATWRRLTVAERLQIVGHDVAVGYRVQFGKRQWLIYRSLAPQANRTLLGQNLSCEFFMGQFLEDGETKELLSIG